MIMSAQRIAYLEDELDKIIHTLNRMDNRHPQYPEYYGIYQDIEAELMSYSQPQPQYNNGGHGGGYARPQPQQTIPQHHPHAHTAVPPVNHNLQGGGFNSSLIQRGNANHTTADVEDGSRYRRRAAASEQSNTSPQAVSTPTTEIKNLDPYVAEVICAMGITAEKTIMGNFQTTNITGTTGHTLGPTIYCETNEELVLVPTGKDKFSDAVSSEISVGTDKLGTELRVLLEQWITGCTDRDGNWLPKGYSGLVAAKVLTSIPVNVDPLYVSYVDELLADNDDDGHESVWSATFDPVTRFEGREGLETPGNLGGILTKRFNAMHKYMNNGYRSCSNLPIDAPDIFDDLMADDNSVNGVIGREIMRALRLEFNSNDTYREVNKEVNTPVLAEASIDAHGDPERVAYSLIVPEIVVGIPEAVNVFIPDSGGVITPTSHPCVYRELKRLITDDSNVNGISVVVHTVGSVYRAYYNEAYNIITFIPSDSNV